MEVNMKLALLFVSIVAFANAEIDPDFKEAMMAKVKEVGMQCAKKEGATQDDVAEIMNHQIPSRHEGKCLIACFNEHFGIQSADGTMNKEGALKTIGYFEAVDKDIHSKMVEVVEKCYAEVTDTGDRCETGLLLAGCAKKTAEEVGLSKDMFM